MELTNLLPKTVIDISLYYKYIDENIIQDKRYIDLMNLVLEENSIRYTYAFYTDTFLLRTNLYIPNFHTMYLSNGNHNVIIEDEKDLWLLDTFTNNKYYTYNDAISYDDRIKIISTAQEIKNYELQ